MVHVVPQRLAALAFMFTLLGSGSSSAPLPYRIVHGVTLASVGAASPQVSLAVPGVGDRTVATATYAAAPGLAVGPRMGLLTPASVAVAPDGQAVAVLPWATDARTVVGRLERVRGQYVVAAVFSAHPSVPARRAAVPTIRRGGVITCVVGRGCRVLPLPSGLESNPVLRFPPPGRTPVAAGAPVLESDMQVPIASVLGRFVRAEVLDGGPVVARCLFVMPRCLAPAVRPARQGGIALPLIPFGLRAGRAVALEAVREPALQPSGHGSLRGSARSARGQPRTGDARRIWMAPWGQVPVPERTGA